jgi:hypothetical protein
MFKACFGTRNFNFSAYGATKKDALKALKKGLTQHAKDYNLPSDWWKEWTCEGLLDEDCVFYTEIEIGRAYRDSELLKK